MKKRQFSFTQLLLTGLACAVAVLGVCAGALFYHFGGTDGWAKSSKFSSILNIIEDNYIGEYDRDAVSEAAYAAMIDAVDDRWSYYMTAEEYEAYKQYVNNEYEGIGVTIQRDDASGYPTVLSVNADSPAEKAGIAVGDLLLFVAGTELHEMEANEIKKIIGAQTGEFELAIRHTDGSEDTVTIKRDTIFSDPVNYRMLDNCVAYIDISNFEVGSAKSAIAAIDKLIDDGAISLIFDVRSNPGGRVSELVELLDYLLPEGDLFVSVDESGVEDVDVSDANFVSMPMAVLINANSYSAAEFFAAALSEYDAAVTVGEKTNGKGRSQITLTLTDGSAVHISSRKYLTPERTDLSEAGGLVPDYAVELSPEYDNQLEKAAETLS